MARTSSRSNVKTERKKSTEAAKKIFEDMQRAEANANSFDLSRGQTYSAPINTATAFTLKNTPAPRGILPSTSAHTSSSRSKAKSDREQSRAQAKKIFEDMEAKNLHGIAASGNTRVYPVIEMPVATLNRKMALYPHDLYSTLTYESDTDDFEDEKDDPMWTVKPQPFAAIQIHRTSRGVSQIKSSERFMTTQHQFGGHDVASSTGNWWQTLFAILLLLNMSFWYTWWVNTDQWRSNALSIGDSDALVASAQFVGSTIGLFVGNTMALLWPLVADPLSALFLVVLGIGAYQYFTRIFHP